MSDNLEYNIPMSQAPKGATVDYKIPQQIESDMPLKVTPFKMIDVEQAVADTAGKQEAASAAQLGDNENKTKYQRLEQVKADKVIIDANLKSGRKLITPDDYESFLKEVGPSLSFDTQQTLTKQRDDLKKAELTLREMSAKSDKAGLSAMVEQSGEIMNILSPAPQIYANAKKAGKTEEEAMVQYKGTLAASVEAASKMMNPYTGKPMFPPEAIAQFKDMPPDVLEQQLGRNAHMQKILKEQIDMEKDKAQTRKYKIEGDVLEGGGKDIASAEAFQKKRDTYPVNSDEWKVWDAKFRQAGSKGKATIDWTPEEGLLMAAILEKSVNLPSSMRSVDAQHALYKGWLAKHPDKSPDEIAQLAKEGKLSMNLEMSEGRKIGGITGAVTFAGEELQQSIPIIRDAIKAVPRTDFIPVNKLIAAFQTGGIQKGPQKELAAYITSLNNQYDVLAGRGGTDKEKREENRKLVMASDSPEGLNAALDAIETELAIAKKAATSSKDIATKNKSSKGKDTERIPVLQDQLKAEQKAIIDDPKEINGPHTANVEAIKKQLESLGVKVESKPTLSKDQQALEWAKANPNDPRAKKILELQ